MPWPMYDIIACNVRGDLARTDLDVSQVDVGNFGTVIDPSYWAFGRQIKCSKQAKDSRSC